MEMKQSIWRKKLRSERGETIGEALAAMLVVALGALMLAAMTSAATRIVTRSEAAYSRYLDQRNAIESGGADVEKNSSEADSNETSTKDGYISFSSGTDATVKVKMKGTYQKKVSYTAVTTSEGKNILVTYHLVKPAGANTNP